MTKQEVIFCEFYEIDDLISNFFGEKVDGFECALDMSNGSYIMETIDGEVDQDELNNYFETKEQEHDTISLLLNEMCRLKQIEKGTYLIEVSW